MAKQYASPTGWFGKLFIGRLLNRSNRLSNQFVLQHLKPQQGQKVLEIGFGGGDLFGSLSRMSVFTEIHGVEPSVEMLDNLSTRLKAANDSRIRLTSGNAAELPYSANYFQRVISVNTLYFWPDLSRGLMEIHRVLANDGMVLLGFASPEALQRGGFHEQGFKLYTPSEIASALAHCGFSDIHDHKLERGERGLFHVITAIREAVQ